MDEFVIFKDDDEPTEHGVLYCGAFRLPVPADAGHWHVGYFYLGLGDDKWHEDHSGPAIGVDLSALDIDRLHELAHKDDPPTAPQPADAEWPGIVCPP